MNYVRQLNAFGEKSIGVLNAKEQAVYLRLFLIANQLKWPEWFEVANSQLMRELGMRWKKTIIDARRELEKKGFIRSVDPGHKMKTRYHLIQLYDDSSKGSKNEPITEPRVRKTNPMGSKNEPYINSINSKHISSTTASQEETFRQVVEVYEKSIRPVPSPADLERLSDCLDHYGKDALLKAIDRADYRGRRSMGYIEGILKSWEQNGYDDSEEEHGHGKADGPRPAKTAGRHRKKAFRFDPEAERRKWANEKSGWD
jgi:DnaD/phage-associated family protein